MTYTSLKESFLWQTMENDCAEYPQQFPNAFRQLEHTFFATGGGSEWSDGVLKDVYEVSKCGLPIDAPYTADPETVNADPREKALYALVPSVRREQFLKGFRHAAAEVRHIMETSDRAPLMEIPYTADVHYIAAAMMMAKHALENPDFIRRDRAWQQCLAAQALNTGFEIVQKRGLEAAFAKSCRALAFNIPRLLRPDPAYIKEENKNYYRHAIHMHAQDRISPRRQLRMAEITERILASILAEEARAQATADQDKPPVPPPPAP